MEDLLLEHYTAEKKTHNTFLSLNIYHPEIIFSFNLEKKHALKMVLIYKQMFLTICLPDSFFGLY